MTTCVRKLTVGPQRVTNMVRWSRAAVATMSPTDTQNTYYTLLGAFRPHGGVAQRRCTEVLHGGADGSFCKYLVLVVCVCVCAGEPVCVCVCVWL